MIRLAFTLLLLVVGGGRAAALTSGGGPATTDCLAEFGGTPANRPADTPRNIRCVDNDPACDADPAVGGCRFRVETCLNVTDPALPACAPAALDGYVVDNYQPDTNGRHDFDFQTLEDRLNFLVLPIGATDLNVCSGEIFMNVPLPVRLRATAVKYRSGGKILRTAASGPGGIVDEDKLRMRCVPTKGTAPCDGITSTFAEIERHIFTGASCSRSTCHNVPQGAHNLSLAPGEAYANLVGVPAANVFAAGLGKLRVDPGNPAGSFIIQKLRGLLDPAEGARMPFGLKKLRELDVQLIEQWIAAGAPATGFVTTLGCH